MGVAASAILSDGAASDRQKESPGAPDIETEIREGFEGQTVEQPGTGDTDFQVLQDAPRRQIEPVDGRRGVGGRGRGGEGVPAAEEGPDDRRFDAEAVQIRSLHAGVAEQSLGHREQRSCIEGILVPVVVAVGQFRIAVERCVPGFCFGNGTFDARRGELEKPSAVVVPDLGDSAGWLGDGGHEPDSASQAIQVGRW